jgi:DNA-directed RNA polymerase specialized sigma24 family protein
MNMNPHNREDLLQDIMLKAWKALPNFPYDERRGRFRGWLATVTKNTALDIELN